MITVKALDSADRVASTEVALRRVAREDLPALETLEKEVFYDLAYSLSYLRSLYDMFSTTWYVAHQDKELAGHALVGLGSDKRTAWLLGLAVGEQYRRKGLGSRLMDKALTTMTESEISDVYLTVRLDNDPARHIYHTFEFTLLRTEPDYYGNGEPREVLHRSLVENPYITD